VQAVAVSSHHNRPISCRSASQGHASQRQEQDWMQRNEQSTLQSCSSYSICVS